MNIVDIVSIIVLSIALIKGFYKGAVGEIFGLLALILALVISYVFHNTFVSLTDQVFTTEYNDSIAYIVAFLTIYISIILLGKILTKTLNALALGPLNKIAGSIIAMAKYALILLIVLYVTVLGFNLLDQDLPVILEESITYALVKESNIFELIQNSFNTGKDLAFQAF